MFIKKIEELVVPAADTNLEGLISGALFISDLVGLEIVVPTTKILYTNMGSAATSTSNPLTEGTHLLRIKKDDAKLLQVFGDGIFSISIRQLGV